MKPSSLHTAFILSFLLTTPLVCVEANFNFTVRFHEYWNPTGLCAECGTNGVPVCCDDPELTESCNNTGVLRCDTRFRFIQRTFDASLETAPSDGFPFFTQAITNANHHIFMEGRGGFLSLPNPHTSINTSTWTGRIQLLVDAFDRTNNKLAPNETEGIVDRFVVNLDQLQLGAELTERATYDGHYRISRLAMSFRVECSENYYGSDCTTFCEVVEGEYNCDSDGNIVCVVENRDPTTRCANCSENYYGSDCSTMCEAVEELYDCDSEGNIVCIQENRDPLKRCMLEPDDGQGVGAALIGGLVGGVVGLVLLIVILLIIIALCAIMGRNHQRKTRVSASSPVNDYVDQLPLKSPSGGRTNTGISVESHDLSNPLYADPNTPMEGINNAIYDEVKQDVTQDVKSTPVFVGTYEVIDSHTHNSRDAAQKGTMFDDPEYSITQSGSTFVASGNSDEGNVPPSVEYDVANVHPTEQTTAVFDNPEYGNNETAVTTSGQYSMLNHNKVTHEATTIDEAQDSVGTGYSKLHHNNNAMVANTLPPRNTQQSPQPVYALATSCATPQDPLVYDYADSPVQRAFNNCNRSSMNNGTPTYTNTTPGELSPEALDHYDLGQ